MHGKREDKRKIFQHKNNGETLTCETASSGVLVDVPKRAGRSMMCVDKCSIAYIREGAI